MTPALRRTIWERGNGICGLCGQPVALDAMHVDHITPRIDGGTGDLDNLQPSHPRCNMAYGRKNGRQPRTGKPLPLLTLVIDRPLLRRVDDFRFEHRFASRAAAIKWLLSWALEQAPTPPAEAFDA